MDLSFWVTTLSLAILVYAGARWLDGIYLAPRRAAGAPQSVKKKRRALGFKKRSKGSNVQNAVNAGSGQQEAKQEPVNVPSVQNSSAPPAPAAAAPVPAEGDFTLSPRELVQLGEALTLYREGATVEQSVCSAFGVTKGGSEGWKRAKALFDAATVAPGAAPPGTYAAPVPVRRARRRA